MIKSKYFVLLYFVNVDTHPAQSQQTKVTKSRKLRKQRTIFNETQLKMLETTFKSRLYPSSEDYESLAREINIDEARLRIWFQNRRARFRKLSRKNWKAMMAASRYYMPTIPNYPASIFSTIHLPTFSMQPWPLGK